MKIYVTGASGTGTSTLAKEISKALSIKHIESDDMFWTETDPPFTHSRDIASLHEIFHEQTSSNHFVLSGDILHWGLEQQLLLKKFTHTVFLYLPWVEREKRIRKREFQKFGNRILKDGDMYETHEAFIKWASLYDTGKEHGRNLSSQKEFLKSFKKRTIIFEELISIESAVEQTLKAIK